MSLITWVLLAALAALSVALAFLAPPPAAEVARLRMWAYRSIILAEWGLVALYLVLLFTDGRNPADFGLRGLAGDWQHDLLLAAGVSAVAIALGELWWALARRRVPKLRDEGLELIRALLPQTRHEKRWALGLALTAACCEEFLFRGFLIIVLGKAVSSVWIAAGVSVLLFALAHAPYGRLGLLSALTGGAALAAAFVATGRLTAPILAHLAYDCYAFFTGCFQSRQSDERDEQNNKV